MTSQRRLLRIGIRPALLQAWMEVGGQLGPFRCAEGQPPGARFVRSYIGDYGTVWLVFEDESFAPVAEGSVIPTRQCIYESLP